MANQQAIHPAEAALDDAALDQLFREARSFSYWQDRPVSDEQLRQLYDLMKWGPTSVNGSPARIFFLRTPEAKQRLVPALSPTNVHKVLAAPVTVIVAYDLRFHEHLPELWPANATYQRTFEDSPALTETTAKRNSSLQGAYLILAARALGLDCGPLSGFNNAKVDEEFFGVGRADAGAPAGDFSAANLRSNFLCNIGYGDRTRLHPRNPRLGFDQACVLL